MNDFIIRLNKIVEYYIVLLDIKPDNIDYDDIPEYLREDKNILVAAIIRKKLQSNKDVVLAAVNQDGYAIDFASEKLKADI